MRNWCKQIVKWKRFDQFIFVCIVFNSIGLSITWYEEPEQLEVIMDYINAICTAIYTLEMIIKVIAYKK